MCAEVVSAESQLKKHCSSSARVIVLVLGFTFVFQSNAHAQNKYRQKIAEFKNKAKSFLVALKPENRHGDYIRNIEKSLPGNVLEDKNVNSMIFDKTIADEMIAKFNAFDKPFYNRENYQLNSHQDYLNYDQSKRDLAEWTIKKLLQYHFENTLRKNVEEGVKREAQSSKSEATKSAAKAVSAISSVHKALQNTTMNFGKDTKTKFKYDFPSGMMRLGLTSPIVDANIDYHVVASPARIGSISSGSEKLSLSMNKNLDFLKASTNFRYGLLEESMNYGVTKQLVQYGGSSGGGSLSAQVDQRHGLKDTSRDETLVRLNFGTSF